MDVFDFAMKMETDAEAFYKKLAEKNEIEGVKRIFSDLAADENKHYHIFEQMKAKELPQAMKDSEALENAKNVFEKLLAEKAQIGPIQGDLESYKYAMKLEAEGYRFYEDAAKRETSEEVKALLHKVAAEEQKHFNIVQNIYDFVNAPNQYLAWSEFSNIEEFKQFGRDVDL